MNPSPERITHLCLANFYIDNYSYQENLLPKFHKRAGHDVNIIASLVTFDDRGQPDLLKEATRYVNEHGIEVTRLRYRRLPFSVRLRLYRGTYRALQRSRPTVLFIHGPQFMDALAVVRYLRRHPDVRVFVDNHADFGNSATNWASRVILHKALWRMTTKLLAKHAIRLYGVLPVRVEFLQKVYGIPANQTQLLVLGGDDDVIDRVRSRTKEELRAKHGLPTDAFVVATGGKVDQNKPEVLNLLRALHNDSGSFDVAFFGNAIPAMRQEFNALMENPRAHHLGWLGTDEALEVLAASDVAVFPGKHSVFWEQTCALGVPMIVRSIEGAKHIDLGGNCLFLHTGDEAELAHVIKRVVDDPALLKSMQTRADSPAREEFLYGRIAASAIS